MSQAASGIQVATPCYFMVIDILGFSQITKNLKGDELAQRMIDWVNLVETTAVEVGVKATQLISDTLFVREKDSVDGLKLLLRFARLMLERGLDKNFPLRGSIVHGDAAWGSLPYGAAVTKAHEREQSLEWVGIVCEPTLPRIDQMWDWEVVAVYPVPTKEGPVRLVPAVVWNVPESTELIHGSAAGGLMAEDGTLHWNTANKWERTVQFGIYLRARKSVGLDPRNWDGSLGPMHFIEKLLKASDTIPT